MQRAPHVLIIDDDPDLGRLASHALRRAGLGACCHRSGEDGLAALEAELFDVVVCDVRMPGIDGVEVCRRIRENYPGVPVVLMTAFASFGTVAGAIRAGATDVLSKPFTIDAFCAAVEQAVVTSRAHLRPRPHRHVPDVIDPPDEVVGSSPVWRRVLAEARAIAGSRANALIVGESGTGKEVLARAIHAMGPRREGPLVAVNCAAVPGGLLESELFGHERGAFTDAGAQRTGLLGSADGGTLFLDEIGAMPLELQPKLLRALQSRTIRPIGASRELPVDVRVLAATNVDLRMEAERGTFRPDLLYRLDVLRIDVPPLRERAGDALELAHTFLEQAAARAGKPIERFSAGAALQIERYRWPGNVRELHNCIESAVAIARGPVIELGDLPPAVRDWHAELVPDEHGRSLESAERHHVQRVLAACDGNRKKAAAALGISRSSLYRKIRKWGIE